MSRKPDFLITGPSQVGTYLLVTALSQHSEIGFPTTMEAPFFSEDENFKKGTGWYYPRFNSTKGKGCVGEALPDCFSRAIPRARIYRHLPEVKVVCILEDPIERLLTSLTERENKDRPPAQLAQELFGENIQTNDLEAVLSCGQYYFHLREWQDIFRPEQVFVLFLEDFVSAPATELAGLLRWLGCSESPVSELNIDLDEICCNISLDLRGSLETTERSRLQDYYRPYNKMLFDHLQRDPSLWENDQ